MEDMGLYEHGSGAGGASLQVTVRTAVCLFNVENVLKIHSSFRNKSAL